MGPSKVHNRCMYVNIGSPTIFDCIGIRSLKESGVSLASEYRCGKSLMR